MIPGNDDAIRAGRLLTSKMADAVIEGREGLDQASQAERDAEAGDGQDEGVEDESEATEEPGDSQEAAIE